MNISILAINYHKKIKTKKKFLADLMNYTDIDPTLIRRAIHHMTEPPHECHEIFFETPKIEALKNNNRAECNKIISARKALSALINNSVINAKEMQRLKLMEDRIIQDYEIDLTDKKALMDNFRSRTDVNSIEDYENYSDLTSGWSIDKNRKINTEQQCEGKLITMLYDYLWRLTEVINEERQTGNKYDYNQKDVFELIAEILNLRWHNKYDYAKIRTLYRNYTKLIKRKKAPFSNNSNHV